MAGISRVRGLNKDTLCVCGVFLVVEVSCGVRLGTGIVRLQGYEQEKDVRSNVSMTSRVLTAHGLDQKSARKKGRLLYARFIASLGDIRTPLGVSFRFAGRRHGSGGSVWRVGQCSGSRRRGGVFSPKKLCR